MDSARPPPGGRKTWRNASATGRPEGVEIHDVSGTADQVWAVGDARTVLRWNGAAWAQETFDTASEWPVLQQVAVGGTASSPAVWVTAGSVLHHRTASGWSDLALPVDWAEASLAGIGLGSGGELFVFLHLWRGEAGSTPHVLRWDGSAFHDESPALEGFRATGFVVDAGGAPWLLGKASTMLRRAAD